MLLEHETEDALREHVVFELQIPWWTFVKTDTYAEWVEARELLARASRAQAIAERPVEELTAAFWDERKHPRHPAGSEAGGEFAPKGVPLTPGERAEIDEAAAEYEKEIEEREAHRKKRIGENVTFDYTKAGIEFEAWAAEMEQWYTEKDGFPPDYWPRERDELWRRYTEAVEAEGFPLVARLETAGVPGVTVEPQLSRAAGGDMDVILDPEAELSPDFDVEMPADLAAHSTMRPGFAVWTFPDERDIIEDILPLDDPDYFPGGVESQTAVNYAKLLDKAANRSRSSAPVTMYRGMSDAELDAWEAGEEIPAGKFFTSQPTAGYSQDIAGEFPVLQQFRIGQDLLVEVAPGEFQLVTKARMVRGRIEPVTGAGASDPHGVEYRQAAPLNPVVLEAMREMAENKRRAAAGLPPLEKKKKRRRAQPKPETTPVAPVEPVENLHVVPIRPVLDDGTLGEIVTKVPPEEVGDKIRELEAANPGTTYDWNPDEHPRWPKGQKRFGKIQGGRFRPKAATAAAWEETKHPRHPSGSEKGGEFAPKGGVIWHEAAPTMAEEEFEEATAVQRFRDLPLAERKAFMARIERGQNVVDDWRESHINDLTHDELNELAAEIEEYRLEDPEDLDGMVEMTEGELLKTAEVQAEIHDGLDRIAELHGLPHGSDRIDVEFAPLGSGTWGQHYAEQFVPGHISEPTETHSKWIRVNPEMPVGDQKGTITHEFGHYLDIQLGGHLTHDLSGGQWFSKGPRAAKWRAAVRATESVQTIERLTSQADYRDYLLTNEELWARSYAQWVALRSGDDTLMRSVRAPGDRDGLPERQWTDTDFGPVAAAIDEIMEPYLKKRR